MSMYWDNCCRNYSTFSSLDDSEERHNSVRSLSWYKCEIVGWHYHLYMSGFRRSDVPMVRRSDVVMSWRHAVRCRSRWWSRRRHAASSRGDDVVPGAGVPLYTGRFVVSKLIRLRWLRLLVSMVRSIHTLMGGAEYFADVWKWRAIVKA